MAIKDNLLIYKVRGGKTAFKTYLDENSLWMDKASIKELLIKRLDPVLNKIKTVYPEDVLGNENFARTVKIAGEPQPIYNLDIITALGYLTRDPEAPRFRRWAYHQLKTGDPDPEPSAPFLGWDYFEQLQTRTSIAKNTEMMFWYKILDLYALSKDYRPEGTVPFFHEMRNKLFWGIFKNTPEELIFDRIDAEKPGFGLLHFDGDKPDKADALLARNFLNEKELQRLDGMIKTFLNMAQSQAKTGKILTTADWISRLEGLLQMTGHTILLNQGKISREEVRKRVDTEFKKSQE